MGIERVTENGEFDHYAWTGSVKGLVDAVGDGDARLGFVVDNASGAKIAMNISGSDDPYATEPFDIESPDGDNLYDANNRREAVRILSNIRRGDKFPDITFDDVPRRNKSNTSATGKKISKRRAKGSPSGFGGVR